MMSELFQDSALLQEIDRFVEEQKDSIVRDIGRLVAIRGRRWTVPSASPGSWA